MFNVYSTIKKTILDIRKTLSSVTNDQLIIRLGSIGVTIRHDLETIQEKLASFELNFEETISFFNKINTNLKKITEIYYKYHLYYITYCLFGILCVLLVIKLTTLTVSVFGWIPRFKTLIEDFSAFRKARRAIEERSQHPEPVEQAFPLIRRY